MRRIAWISGAVLAAALTLPTGSYAGDLTHLELAKTVGINPVSCAAAKDIVVAKGTTVVYCYQVTNFTSVTLTTHTLLDSVLGPITLPNGGNFDLPPGESKIITATQQINATTINVATWTAMGTDTATSTATAPIFAPQIVEVAAMSEAKVSIGATAAPALGEAALAFVAAALLAFGALRLSRKLQDPS